MIFKRNAKGLLEREVASSSFQESPHACAPQPEAHRAVHPGSFLFSAQESRESGETPVSSPSLLRGEPLRARSAPSLSQKDFQQIEQDSPPSLSLQEFEDSANEVPETTLGEGVVFKGELLFKRYLSINGEFEGVLVSTGKLRVGKTGWVKSNLHLKSAVIEGKVEGDIFVEDLLELRGSARVRGNITARYLRVDDGVTLVGHVNICPEGPILSEESDR